MRIDRKSVPKGLLPDAYFNGKKHERVFEANTDEGWIVTSVPRDDGSDYRPSLLDPPGDGEWDLNGIVVTRHYGDVRLEFTLTDLDGREVVLVEKRGT